MKTSDLVYTCTYWYVLSCTVTLNVYTGMYQHILVCIGTKHIEKICIIIGFELTTSCIVSACPNRLAMCVNTSVLFKSSGWNLTLNCGTARAMSPGGWCQTSGVGPAAPPPPAMTWPPPARASTWISRMPLSASRQCLAVAMWRRTAPQLRNRPRLDSRPVDVQ